MILQELKECEGKVFVDSEPEFAFPEASIIGRLVLVPVTFSTQHVQ